MSQVGGEMHISTGLPIAEIFIIAASASVAFGTAFYSNCVLRNWKKLPEATRESDIPDALHILRKWAALGSLIQLCLIFFAPAFFMPAGTNIWRYYLILAAQFVIMIASSIYRNLIEKDIRGASAPKSAYIRAGILGITLCLSGQLFIWGSNFGIGKVADFAGPLSPWVPMFPLATSIAFSFFKSIFGIFVFFCFYPWIMRFALQLKTPEDDEHLANIREVLTRGGFKDPQIWYMTYDNMKYFNAMVYSNPFFGRRGRPTIVVSKSLVTQLSSEEIEAVLFHEISHHRLRHISKRIFTYLGFVVCFYFLGLFLFPLIMLISGKFMFFAFIMIRPIQFIAPLLLLSWVIRVQELQADAHAVFHFGVKPEAMKSSLEKMYKLNHMLTNKRNPNSYFSPASAHPTLEFRQRSISSVSERLARKEPMFQWRDYFTGSLESKPVPSKYSAAAFTMAVSLIALFWGGHWATSTFYNDDGIAYKERESSRPAGEYGLSGSDPSVSAWLKAIEARDVKQIETLAIDSKSKTVFQDAVWGKFVFYSATDSSPEVLEAVLQKINIPEEFIEHAVLRLNSLKNKKALNLILKYSKEKQHSRRDVASGQGKLLN